MSKARKTTARTTQTVRINGARVRLVTQNGKVTTIKAAPLEWELQAAAVRRLRGMDEYGRRFLLVGGMEAGRRGRNEAAKALATGLTAGHPDLTVFLLGGRCGFIEYKAANGRLSPEQTHRHAALRAIGHNVEVVKAVSEVECADATEALVRGWLAADNDNKKIGAFA